MGGEHIIMCAASMAGINYPLCGKTPFGSGAAFTASPLLDCPGVVEKQTPRHILRVFVQTVLRNLPLADDIHTAVGTYFVPFLPSATLVSADVGDSRRNRGFAAGRLGLECRQAADAVGILENNLK